MYSQLCVLCRGQISKDYEREFSHVKVGPIEQKFIEMSKHRQCKQVSVCCFPNQKMTRFDFLRENVTDFLFLQDAYSEDYWEKLARESDPSRQQRQLLNHNNIVPQIKSKILAFKDQVIKYSL